MAKTTMAVSITETRAAELKKKSAELGCSVSFLAEILIGWGLTYLKEKGEKDGKED